MGVAEQSSGLGDLTASSWCGWESRMAEEERPDAIERLILWSSGCGKVRHRANHRRAVRGTSGCELLSRTAEGRSGSSRLIATITWQLIQAIQAIPEIREIILDLLECNPTFVNSHTSRSDENFDCIVDPLNAVLKEILGNRPV